MGARFAPHEEDRYACSSCGRALRTDEACDDFERCDECAAQAEASDDD